MLAEVRVCSTEVITSPLSTTPHDLGLSESQRQIVSRRVRQLAGGAGEWSNRGALGNGWARKPAARICGRRCTRARVRGSSRVMMCVKSILSPMSCGNYIPARIRPSECSKVLWPFSQTISN